MRFDHFQRKIMVNIIIYYGTARVETHWDAALEQFQRFGLKSIDLDAPYFYYTRSSRMKIEFQDEGDK